MSKFADAKCGSTVFAVALTQNVWTLLTTQCPHRKSLSFSPTNPSVVIQPGINAPPATPTLPTQYQYSPKDYNDVFDSAMVKMPFWALTSVAGVSVIITEELHHCECEEGNP